ncbi:hypothetical protein TWF594_003936 [Orbilia oligospora]|uniref:Uncharacterized protein n=1 Tax=Orbilia oligospora TaxID=2813651 RepID=A0A7C8NVB6_ORBOL|nr:hypothetical protein TWF594_003936 [Orbilia oligospora]KAF3139793.1 hypothetical protein TWF703_003371 [Orbilia oligospora]
MKLLQVLAFAASASAAVVFPRADDACNKDNCLNAVIKNDPAVTAERFSACESYVASQTITSLVYVTTSSTDTITITASTTLPNMLKRDVPIPTWAANCQSKNGVPAEIRFSSACSCYFKSFSRAPVTMPTTTQTVSAVSSFATTITTIETHFTPTPTKVYIKATDVGRSEEVEGGGTEFVVSPEWDGAYLKLNTGGDFPIFGLTKVVGEATTFYARQKTYFDLTVGRIYLDSNAQTHQFSIGAPIEEEGDSFFGPLVANPKPHAQGVRPMAYGVLEGGDLEWVEDVVYGEPARFFFFAEGVTGGMLFGNQGDGFPDGGDLPYQLNLATEVITPV